MSPETKTKTATGQRARLIQPDDQPSFEEIVDLTDQQLTELPARFHTPVWNEAQPGAFVCAVCWGDGWCTGWPCATARKNGAEVFAQ